MTLVTTGLVLAWIAIIILAVALSGLSRTVARLARGPEVSSSHPIAGRLAPSIPELGDSISDATLMFVDPTCLACLDRIADLRDIGNESEHSERDLVLVTTYPVEAFKRIDVDGFRLITVDQEVIDAFEAHTKPFGVVTDSEGIVRRASSLGNRDALFKLLLPLGPQGG